MTTPKINQLLRDDLVGCSRGAPLGARNFNDAESSLYLQRIVFVGYDYAADGTYWGSGGDPLWCAFNGDDDDFAAGRGTRIYVRAASRSLAMQAVADQYPDVTFKRGHDVVKYHTFDLTKPLTYRKVNPFLNVVQALLELLGYPVMLIGAGMVLLTAFAIGLPEFGITGRTALAALASSLTVFCGGLGCINASSALSRHLHD